MGVHIQIDDMQLRANLDKMPAEMRRGVVMCTAEACERIEEAAVDRVPVASTALLQSITHAVADEGDLIVGAVGCNTEYAIYVHEGTGIYAAGGNGRQMPWHWRDEAGNWHTTRGQEPQPFLREAADACREDILQIFTGVLDNVSL